jgi:hypothetical protein
MALPLPPDVLARLPWFAELRARAQRASEERQLYRLSRTAAASEPNSGPAGKGEKSHL